MAQIDQGPATGTAVYVFGNQASIEVHVPNGLPSFEPQDAPFVDPQAGTTAAASPINKTVAGVRFAVPA